MVAAVLPFFSGRPSLSPFPILIWVVHLRSNGPEQLIPFRSGGFAKDPLPFSLFLPAVPGSDLVLILELF